MVDGEDVKNQDEEVRNEKVEEVEAGYRKDPEFEAEDKRDQHEDVEVEDGNVSRKFRTGRG